MIKFVRTIFFRPANKKQGLFRVFGGVAITSLLFLTPDGAFASSAVTITDSMPTSIPASIIADWEAQDSITGGAYGPAIDKIIQGLPSKFKANVTAGTTKQAYLVACHWRRVARMYQYSAELKKIIFTRHYNLGGPFPASLADLEPDNFQSGIGTFQSSTSRGANYEKKSALCLLELKNYYSKSTDLVADSTGVIRDPNVWFDGSKVAFAWSKDNKGYHLYEMPVDSVSKIRPLTADPEGLTVSDFEPCYLPDSNIIFNSSRSFGLVSSLPNSNTNLFIINKDGKYLRRITYDQNANYSPSVMEDGYVLYTRWEATDRDQYNGFPLMSMNVDGVHQIEYYGGQTVWPAAFFQARRIPGSMKILSIISVYQSPYAGELATIDPLSTRNGAAGVQLIAPVRQPADTTSYITGARPLFQSPFPFDEECFLVSWRPIAQDPYKQKFSIYFMNTRGERELLAWDSLQSVSQPVSLKPIPIPRTKMYQADYAKTTGKVTLYNAYYGMAVDKSIDSAAGAIKKLRVIGIDLRTDPAFGSTGSQGFCMTPVARWLGTRDAKRVIGEAPVAIDGSAAFVVPARTPVYFQLIDSNGCMIQTMRSTVVLQPGETFSCVGCHEDKNKGSAQGRLAINYAAKPLDKFFDISDTAFSFPKIIQPILDKNCATAGCHDAAHSEGLDLRGEKFRTGDLTDADNKNAGRSWNLSYWKLTDTAKHYVNFIMSNSPATAIKCNTYGSKKSTLIEILRAGHKDIVLTAAEMGKLCAWIDLSIPFSGTYTEGLEPAAAANYEMRLARRTKHEQLESANIAAFMAAGGYPLSVAPQGGRTTLNPGMANCRISATYARANRLLSVKIPAEGTISIVNLQGRLVWSRRVGHDAFVKNASISVKTAFPAGLYIVNYTGIGSAARLIVSIL